MKNVKNNEFQFFFWPHFFAFLFLQDWNQEIRLSGDLRWAPFGATEAEELQLAGYDISVVDPQLQNFNQYLRFGAASLVEEPLVTFQVL